MPVRETPDPSYEPKIVAFYADGVLKEQKVSNMTVAQIEGIFCK
jgi:hypothetical protein